jgi:hypothetical protein
MRTVGDCNWLAVQRASYEGQHAEGRYRAVDPDNRLVAPALEREWEECLKALAAAKADLARREASAPPYAITQHQRDRLLAVGADLISVWNASTTTLRDRKELLQTLIDEVIVKVERDAFAAHLTLRWKGGAPTEIDLDLPRSRTATIRTDKDTVVFAMARNVGWRPCSNQDHRLILQALRMRNVDQACSLANATLSRIKPKRRVSYNESGCGEAQPPIPTFACGGHYKGSKSVGYAH